MMRGTRLDELHQQERNIERSIRTARWFRVVVVLAAVVNLVFLLNELVFGLFPFGDPVLSAASLAIDFFAVFLLSWFIYGATDRLARLQGDILSEWVRGGRR